MREWKEAGGVLVDIVVLRTEVCKDISIETVRSRTVELGPRFPCSFVYRYLRLGIVSDWTHQLLDVEIACYHHIHFLPFQEFYHLLLAIHLRTP